MSPSGPIKSCVFHEFTSFQELRPRRKTLSFNWDLDSCPDTSRGGAKEEGVVEGNSFTLAIKGLWASETRQKSLILRVLSTKRRMAGPREPAGRQWKEKHRPLPDPSSGMFHSLEKINKRKAFCCCCRMFRLQNFRIQRPNSGI